MLENWQEWIEYIEPVYETHGAGYALKLMRECEKRFFEERAARFDIYDLRPHSILEDRKAYTSALESQIREALCDVLVQTKLFTIERAV
jgi:hypothetical protein